MSEPRHHFRVRAWRDRSDRLIYSLVRAKDEAFRLGLWKTGHALDKATKEIGWEVAAHLAEPKEERDG